MIKSDLPFFENDEKKIQTTIGLTDIVLHSLILHLNILVCEITILSGKFQNKSDWMINEWQQWTHSYIHTHTTHNTQSNYSAFKRFELWDVRKWIFKRRKINRLGIYWQKSLITRSIRCDWTMCRVKTMRDRKERNNEFNMCVCISNVIEIGWFEHR